MNYEDRTDLLPPEQVVSAPLLAKLRLIPDADRLMTLFLDMQGRSVSSAAYEAIVLRAAEDTAPGRGAPAGEWAAEEDAMLCGYRFGRLALGSLPRRRPVSPEEIRRRADSMYLYGLFVWDASTPDGRVPVEAILIRHESEQLHALEEAVTWAWAFGLGVALVEADLDAAGQQAADSGCLVPAGRGLPVGGQAAGPGHGQMWARTPSSGRGTRVRSTAPASRGA